MSRLPIFLLFLTFAGLLCPLEGQTTPAERYLFEAANQERASYNLPPLSWSSQLATAADGHARLMAGHHDISHRFDGELDLSERGSGAGARFSLISENVAEASLTSDLHEAWMASAGHRENILDPKVTAVGIAVVLRDRQLYAVQDFARITPVLSLEEQEAAVFRLLARAGVNLLSGSAEARPACALESGFNGVHRPGFIMRYTAAALDRLPAALIARIASRRYSQAAVGACEDRGSGSFSSYRLAVLLYP